MSVRSGDSAAGSTQVRAGISARIQVGRFVLELGSPAGTRAELAPEAAPRPDELARALAEPEAPATLARAEAAVDEAESVTGRVERALELFTAVAQGRVLDRKILLKEVDVILGALERADREGRYADVLRIARALTSLLALLGRWVALAQSLRVALNAARSLGDARGIAWARHELGTFALGADDAAAATGDLEEARRLREEIGDKRGAEATRHNLRVLRQAFPGHGTGRWLRPSTVALVAAGALLVGVAAVAVAVPFFREDDSPSLVDATAPEVEITESPDETTRERSASFAFEADEGVRRFECRLDGAAFARCVSPANFDGPLALGEHVFAVRAIDLARNRGEPASFSWTIEAGEGPAVAIRRGPDELTNDARAEFAIDPGEAVSLQCSLDGGDFESCPTLVAFEVEEGEHELVVRGVDAEGTEGPPATYRWTLDTTPPTIEITELEPTDSTVVIVFEASEPVSALRCSLVARTTQEGEPASEPPCESPITYSDLASGTTYTFQVAATDAAGNEGEPASREFATESGID